MWIEFTSCHWESIAFYDSVAMNRHARNFGSKTERIDLSFGSFSFKNQIPIISNGQVGMAGRTKQKGL